jgi:mono/diheme cytochrome c family protein
MRRIPLYVAAGALLYALAAPALAQDAKAARGQKVYEEQKCSVCHSIGDKGNKKGPLDDVGSKYKAEELREWLVNPQEMAAKAKATRKPMKKPYTQLPKEDLDALVAYMQTLKK